MNQECRVLVADDQPAVCELFRSTLGGRAAVVHGATNEQQAVELLKSQAIDLMFVNLRLADGSGLDLLRTAHQTSQQLMSVVITGCGTLESAVEAMRIGACDYIVQPFDREEILRALDRAQSYKRLNLSPPSNPSDPGTGALPPAIQIVVASPQMREVLESATLAAQSDIPILIEGEGGCGKQLLARWIHQRSREPDSSFIHFPCAGMKDARPGAEHPDWQRFVLGSTSAEPASASGAAQCTFYVEHVEELPTWAQRQLLQSIERTWPCAPEYANPHGARVRVIASAKMNLDPAVASGAFSRGLYDALRLTPLYIAPLRKRSEDIRALVFHFLERFCHDQERDPGPYRRMIAEETWQSMLRYGWPGNVRELFSLIARALLSKDDRDFERILMCHVSAPALEPSCDMISVPAVGNLRNIERSVIREYVRRCGGNKASAARALGMHRRTLYRFLQQN
jgi:DNA-binding NtrC family response regulator